MTSAHTLFILNQGRSLKRLAAKGKLSATALAAAGGAIMAASTAQAQSKSKIADDAAVVSMDASSGASVVVGQGLVGATHTHASGLQHNHGPPVLASPWHSTHAPVRCRFHGRGYGHGAVWWRSG